MTIIKPILLVAVLPLAFAGCTSTNPNAAFDDVSKRVASRTGQEVHWMRDDDERGDMGKAVEALLQTNVTAQSAVSIALLNNRTLQAGFEEIGISQAELSAASRLRNPDQGRYRSVARLLDCPCRIGTRGRWALERR